MKPRILLRSFKVYLVIAFLCSTTLYSQPSNPGAIHQSIPSRSFGLPSNVQLSAAERNRITKELFEVLKRVNEDAHEEADPGFFGSVVDFAGGVVNRVADDAIDAIKFTGVGGVIAKGVLGETKDRIADWLSEDDQAGYLATRDFAIRKAFEEAMTKGVNGCTGDINCIDKVANDFANDSDVQGQFKEAGDLGIFDDAHTRALIKAAKDQAVAQYTGTVIKIDNLDVKITGIIADVKNTMIVGFQQINNDQRKIINGIATLINIEQRQTIALQNIQTTLNENFTQINAGITNIIDLQQINLFISSATLEAVGIIDQKVDVLNQNINVVSQQITNLSATVENMQIEQRNQKIQEIFNNSPFNVKIEQLQNVNSSITKLILKQPDGEKKRQTLIANFKELKMKQDIVIAQKMINEWGKVGKEAISIFCKDCPEELSQGIDGVMTASNIVGNFASGNYAGVVMSVLGIFKKPEPSPELKMLQKISQQVASLERNMNAQFRQVHQNLFAIEENLGNRMQIVDFKVEQLTEFVLAAHVQVMEQLSGIDSKLNYIINQNECTKDLLLKLTQQGGQDLCKAPVAEFKNRALSGQIKVFQDLDNFFRGNFCQPCVKALFDASNVFLTDNASFRYAQCSVEGADNKARPDKAYEFIFQHFIRENAADSVFVNSLLLIPADVKIAASFPDSVQKFLNKSILKLFEEDRNFRNHRAIIAYADYLLTMFTMIEFFDNNRLLTPVEISQNPGFSRERARKMILVLEGVQDLLNHSMFQQSLLAGNGIFTKLDQLITNGSNVVPAGEVAEYTLADIFTYNPYLSKNYAAYLIDKHIGLDRLKDIIENNRLKKGKQRLSKDGINLLLFEDAENKPRFVISLTNLTDPEKHIALMEGFLSVADNKIDEELYKRNLEFVFPAAYLELQSVREKIIGKLAEMNLIVSPELDNINANFSREDLERLISASKN